jgi:prepilin-type N-terminal cleavage/methylation domain-containing protein
MKIGIRQQNGFTLMEIVITIVLITIVAGIAAMIILQGVRSFSSGRSKSDLQYRTALALERMERDIRTIGTTPAGLPAIVTMTASSLTYTDVNNSAAGFSWTSPVLSRWNGASYDTLATGVSACSFSYLKQDLSTSATASTVWFIDVAMTTQDADATIQTRTRIHPRNF